MSHDPKRVEAVFAAALEKESPDQRSAYLDEVCAGDLGLRQRVEALLMSHNQAGSFLELPVREVVVDPDITEALTTDFREPTANVSPGPTRVRYFGNYELLEEIARGGMGVVYKARQVSLQRIVALKMILAGQLASPADVNRFYREAQTAAKLQHPNIVAIHEVGQHDGQHYFSMDFVEGESLAALVRESPLPPAQACRYVQAIAVAIHHAHEQGVLHRDLKPSNILIDGFDQPRVTDFGLAKQIARDASATATGAVMGTPSYMPPEQAEGKSGDMGPAGDVYSLGAVLYELVTGRPPFRAATPVETLQQVLHSEPASPRLLNPGVGRDLETIILKCLAKEPKRRYASAASLADDLTACLEGRPIKARRPSLAERSIRWLRRQRRSVVLAGAAAAASILLVIAAMAGWRWYVESRQGQVRLNTSDPVRLTAEMLTVPRVPLQPRGNEDVLPRFTLPTEQPLALPGGSYRLRVSGPGQVSETFPLLVEKGTRQAWDISLRGRQLWEPITGARGVDVVNLAGHPDIIAVREKTVHRFDGVTGKEIWQRSLDAKDLFADRKKAAPVNWRRLAAFEWVGFGYFERPLQPWLVQPAPDLDGDGTGDVIWAGRTSPWLLAMSGKDGAVKWWFQSPHHKIEDHPAPGVVCTPVIEDVDGDGVPDILVTFGMGWVKDPPEWVEAISGKTGQSLWRHVIPPPQAGPGHQNPRRVGDRPEGSEGPFQTQYASQVIRRDGRKVLLVVGGRRVVGVDVQTGQAAWKPRQLAFNPVAMPVFADLIGQGKTSLLFIDAIGAPQGSDFSLQAVSLEGEVLWRHKVEQTSSGRQHPWPPFNWPVVEDLDGDGKPEVLVPHHKPWSGSGWVGVEVLDGATGQSRWARRLARAHRGAVESSGVAHLLAGPDLDGDGCRDVIMAALIGAPTFEPEPWNATETMRPHLFVAACSGADGQTLWQYLQPIDPSQPLHDPRIASLGWGPLGSDGRPQLLVSYSAASMDSNQPNPFQKRQAGTLFFAASTGQVTHSWPGVGAVLPADCNGDGLVDLVGIQVNDRPLNEPPYAPVYEARVHTLRGGPPELWRRPGLWQPAAGGKYPRATGAIALAPSPVGRIANPSYGDLDGDGQPDHLVFWPSREFGQESGRLRAYSGADGRRLWQCNGMTGSPRRSALVSECLHLECRVLDDTGLPGVCCTYLTGPRNNLEECWLAVLSGRSGKVLWKDHVSGFRFDISGGQNIERPLRLEQTLWADLNGDGTQDVVYLARTVDEAGAGDPRRGGFELRARDGRDGRLLWKHPGHPFEMAFHPDKKEGGIILLASRLERRDVYQPQLEVLRGKDGQSLWTWQPAKPSEFYHLLQGASVAVFADLEGNGTPAICASVLEREKHPAIQVINAQGKLLKAVARSHSYTPHDAGFPESINEEPMKERKRWLSSRSLGLWSADLKGDGKKELIFQSDNKVQVYGGNLEKPRWQWPLPDPVAGILDVVPGSSNQPGIVFMQAKGIVYGLDGATGKLRWKCHGPGHAVAVTWRASGVLKDSKTPDVDADAPPEIWFQQLDPAMTVCRQALPVDKAGKYTTGQTTPVQYDLPLPDLWKVLPLPWAHAGRQHLVVGLLLAAIALLPILYFAWKRQWWMLLAMLACFVLIPLAVGAMEIHQRRKLPDMDYDWSGWPLLWPHTFFTPLGWALLRSPLLWMGVLVIWLRMRRKS